MRCTAATCSAWRAPIHAPMTAPQSPPATVNRSCPRRRISSVNIAGDRARADVEAVGGPREAVAGDRRDDHVVTRAQRLDHVEVLGDRSGPTVDQQQRRGIGVVRLRDDRVDRHAVDRRPDLGVPVAPPDPRLELEPVRPAVAQPAEERASVPSSHSVPGIWSGQRVRPSRSRRSVISASSISTVNGCRLVSDMSLPGSVHVASS